MARKQRQQPDQQPQQDAPEPARPRGRPATGPRDTVTLYLRVAPEVAEALEAYRAGLPFRLSGNAAAEAALREFLVGKGLIPS